MRVQPTTDALTVGMFPEKSMGIDCSRIKHHILIKLKLEQSRMYPSKHHPINHFQADTISKRTVPSGLAGKFEEYKTLDKQPIEGKSVVPGRARVYRLLEHTRWLQTVFSGEHRHINLSFQSH